MEFAELLKRRTIRFFRQEKVAKPIIESMLEAAAVAPCATNRQILRYIVIQDQELRAQIFPQTRYAGFVQPKRSPEPGVTAPTGFIAITAPQDNPTVHADAGAAILSMEFAAWEQGVGCCQLGAFDAQKVHEILELASDIKVIYLLAFGYPAESPLLERIGEHQATRYYLDQDDVLHVPKYTLDAITLWR